MEVTMFNKSLLPAVIVAASQIGMMHYVSAMEPEIKSEKQEEEFSVSADLSAEEKERLFQEYKAMKQITKDQLPQDVQEYTGQYQYAVAPKSIFKFKCPTPNQIREKLGNPEKATGLFFPIVEDLNFIVMERDGVSVAEKNSNIIIINDHRKQPNFYNLTCAYNQGDNEVLQLNIEVPMDKYILTSDAIDIQGKKVSDGVNVFFQFKDNVEFTITKKDTQKK